MDHLVELRYVKVFSNLLLYEDFLIVMEGLESVLEHIQGCCGLHLQTSEVDEINSCPCCVQNL